MDYYLSLETCKQLKEWGCDVATSIYYLELYDKDLNPRYVISNKKSRQIKVWYPTYDIRDIICNEEITKSFFGIYTSCKLYKNHSVRIWEHDISVQILLILNKNKIEGVEKYILENTSFNPKNK